MNAMCSQITACHYLRIVSSNPTSLLIPPRPFPADVKDESIDLTDSGLVFKGKSDGKDYEVNIEFFKPVDSSEDSGSTYKVQKRSVHMHIMKAAAKEEEDGGDDDEFWPRLLKDKALEKNQVKIDWDRYVDEDEEDEAGGFDTSALDGGAGMGGMPGMGMGGMPGMGGEGGMDLASMMGGMGGMGGGAGGMGGMDMEALMKQMGGMGDMGDGPDGDEGDPADDIDDDDDDDLPELENP